MKDIVGSKPDGTKPFYFLGHNVYVVPTPLGRLKRKPKIEDFFEKSVLDTKLNGKKFNPSNKGFDPATEYGKARFATKVVRENQDTISFAGFTPLLNNIAASIDDYDTKKP